MFQTINFNPEGTICSVGTVQLIWNIGYTVICFECMGGNGGALQLCAVYKNLYF